MCCRCKSTNVRDESIKCSLCEYLFHAVCRDKAGVFRADSIATVTGLTNVRPMISKYGPCQNRWGHFLFCCEMCMTNVKKVKSTSEIMSVLCQTDNEQDVTAGSMSVLCQTDIIEDVTITAVEDKDTVKDDVITNVKDTNSNNPGLSSNENLIEHMNSLFKSMKGEILKDVESLISSKLTVSSNSVSSNSVSQREQDGQSNSTRLLYTDLFDTSPGINTRMRQAHPSSDSMTSGYSTDTVQSHVKQDKIVVLSTENTDCEVDAVVDAIDKEFKNVQFTLVKKNKINKKIILGFPTEKEAEDGKELLKTLKTVQDNKYVMSDAKKMLPKITIANVPNYLVSQIVAEKNKMTPDVYRQELKTYLLGRILDKNETIKEFKENGKIFDIVYVNVGKKFTTLGVKVSPVVREDILFNRGVYVGNTRCPIYDRFFIKQCFKCQKVGHISIDCKEAHVICMYCSGSHQTGTCPNKLDTSQFRCRNCAQSNDPAVKFLCTSHHSGSNDCPTIIKERVRLQERTDYSKN